MKIEEKQQLAKLFNELSLYIGSGQRPEQIKKEIRKILEEKCK